MTARNLSNLGLAVLFAGALLTLVFTSLRPLFRSSAQDALSSSKAPALELKDPEVKPVKV
jgi:hypothetical protein